MLTPAEFDRKQRQHIKRRERDEKDRKVLAWTTAMLMRQKRLPTLQTFITPPRIATGAERERLERQHADMAAWATEKPVKLLAREGT